MPDAVLSLLETPISTEEAAAILALEPKLAQQAVADGTLRKTVHNDRRQKADFRFHGYFDILEFNLTNSHISSLATVTDEFLTVGDFLDDWAATLERVSDNIPLTKCEFQKVCRAITAERIGLEHEEISVYVELLYANPNYKFPSGDFVFVCSAVGLVLLKRVLDLLSYETLPQRHKETGQSNRVSGVRKKQRLGDLRLICSS